MIPGPGSTDEQVAVVIVTYNSAQVIDPLLAVLASSTEDTIHQVVIIDNASTDDTLARVSHSLPSANIIRNTDNVGFATAVNRAVEATSTGLVLIANPDVQWSDGTLSRLVRSVLDHPRAAAVCPRLVFQDGRSQPSVRKFPTHLNIWLSRQSPLRILRHLLPARHSYTVLDPEIPTRVEAVAAACVLIRRVAFNAVGGMDAGYFLYVEDTDLCKRWHDRGYEVWIDPTVTVTHDWQGGSGNRRRLRQYHRDGIRRYFRTHHATKRIRNAILSAALLIADWWDQLRTDTDGDART